MLAALTTLGSSIITGLVAIYVCNVQNNKNMVLIQYRLEQLEKKVDQHNNLDRRVAILESKINM